MKKNILVVDDSALMRRIMCDIINAVSDYQATDYCRDGLEAYEKLKTKNYDGVVLDINMPRMNGLELLERLRKEHIQANVVVVSTINSADVTILAIERGAIDFIQKPTNVIEAKGEEFKSNLISVLNALFDSKAGRKPGRPSGKPRVTGENVRERKKTTAGNKLVALACSTGGPKALQRVIPYLPKNLDAPVVLVQHMPAGFTKSMADRLNELSTVTVTEAVDREPLEKGHVYIAPGGRHMEVVRGTDGVHRISLNDMPPIGGLRPCANVMYESLAKAGYDEIVCVVLTGMGGDGTNGIRTLSQSRQVHVIAEDEASCVVYGMPRAVAEAGLVDEVVSLADVAKTITKNVGVK
ncbi:MAG: chemotaxis-specific protein-glutamate methyltransferase CheB [Lachnospiraceae bacterium]|nr:chemotaxis-specific protein-glutamate methyltransferase CheB [Lachnospiraceae bacterium]